MGRMQRLGRRMTWLVGAVLAAVIASSGQSPARGQSRSEQRSGAGESSGEAVAHPTAWRAVHDASGGCAIIVPSDLRALSEPPLPPDYALSGSTSHRIVCKFFVVRTSAGVTNFTDMSLIDGLMRDFNHGFRGTPFSFVRLPGVTFIDNSAFYTDLETGNEIFQLFSVIDAPGTLDVVLVPSILGGFTNGAAAIPPLGGPYGIVLDSDDVGTGYTRTGPHELGHAFGLHHPFETMFGAECTSGSNCSFAGDRICDTPATPIVHSGNMTATGIYLGGGNGPCPGDPPYAPLTDLYMEAGWPAGLAGGLIPSRFTAQQLAIMNGGMASFNSNLVGPSRPAVVVDCDNNGLDDVDEIINGTKVDVDHDKVPDICQSFPLTGDLLVSGMNNLPGNRPLFFDGLDGTFIDELRAPTSWVNQMRIGPQGLVYLTTQNVVQRIDLKTKRVYDNLIDSFPDGATFLVDFLFEPDGHILVLDNSTSTIRRYDGTSGAYMGIFIDLTLAGVSFPRYMEYGPDGHIYVVGNGAGGNAVHRVDGVSGAYLGTFVDPGSGELGAGQGLHFHTDGLLYVSNGTANNVLQFDALTGDFVDVFVDANSGGLSNPNGLRFGPDGNLYVASRNTHSVKRYAAGSGAYLGDFVSPGSGGLSQPTGLLFVPPKAAGEVPTMGTWGLIVMGLLVVLGGTAALRGKYAGSVAGLSD